MHIKLKVTFYKYTYKQISGEVLTSKPPPEIVLIEALFYTLQSSTFVLNHFDQRILVIYCKS